MNAQTRRFTRVSGRAEAILGYPADRWSTIPGFWIGVLHPDDRERVAHAVWRALRERNPCEIEYRAVAADGSVVTLRDRVKVLPGPDGASLILQGAITDLTPRQASQPPSYRPPRRWRRGRYPTPAAPTSPPVVRAPEPPQSPPAPPFAVPVPAPPPAASFSPDSLLATLGEAVIASDSDHRIVYWNRAAEALFGVPAETALGQPDAELLRTRTSAGQTAEIIGGLLGRRPWSAEVSIAGPADIEIPVRITASALRDDGRILGYVAVITDLRDVRRSEAARGAAAAMDAVARLARGVAIELSEGVQHIEAAVRTAISRVGPSDPTRATLDDALRSVDATAALASQLAAVGRDRPSDIRPTDLRGIVRRGLPAISLLAGRDIAVVTELDPTTANALVDPRHASQILFNLAANAVGAMPGGGRLEIAITSVEIGPADAPEALLELAPGRVVVLEIRDTRDLPADEVELMRFFEPFSEPAAPPGMSLAAAHGLAVLNGGHLEAIRGPEGVVLRLLLPPASAERT